MKDWDSYFYDTNLNMNYTVLTWQVFVDSGIGLSQGVCLSEERSGVSFVEFGVKASRVVH